MPHKQPRREVKEKELGLLRRLRPPPPAAVSLEATLGLGDKENTVCVGQCFQVLTGMCTKLERAELCAYSSSATAALNSSLF